MKTRFHKNAKVADIMVTAIGGTLSVGVTLYGVYYFGLSETWPEFRCSMCSMLPVLP